MPAIRPPPPTGTNTACRSSWRWRTISIADRALTGDHQQIVERVDERETRFGDERVAIRLRVGIAVAVQFDLGAHAAHRVHLDLRRGLRHDDGGVQSELARGERDALRVIAGAGGDHAARALIRVEVRDAVVGAAQLEAEDGLQILALEMDARAEPRRQQRRRIERRIARDVVDAAGQIWRSSVSRVREQRRRRWSAAPTNDLSGEWRRWTDWRICARACVR